VKMKSEIKVAVLMGGPSREREISLRSGKAISQGLRSLGYRVLEITEMENLAEQLLKERVQAAFIALHGRFGEDGTVQKILEDAKITYTGSGPEASFIAMNKNLAKEKFEKAGLKTPRWASGFFENFEKLKLSTDSMRFPIVMKPVDEGSSIGLEIVKVPSDLIEAYGRIRSVSQNILIEEFIQGRELTVGILGEKPLPVVEIRTDRNFYDFVAKYTPGHTEYIVPAELSEAQKKSVQETGLKAYQVLGCRDFSRVDILLDAQGISFEVLCGEILSMALKRSEIHAEA
jgi:D-alanine-D-alanine ligase